MPIPGPALLPELPYGSHWWTVERELVEDIAGGMWVTRFTIGRGWARCSCGLRIEGPGGGSVPLAQVEAELVDHLDQARADGDDIGGQADGDARETGP
jgi:hypothetical protein